MNTNRSVTGSRNVRTLVAMAIVAASIPATAFAQSFPELDAARTAAQASPTDAEAQARLGDALLEARDIAGARAAFEAALRARANWVRALWGLARTRMAEGNYEESRSACQKVIHAAGQASADGHVCMGQAYLVWRRSSLAIEEFDKALEADPSNAQALCGIGDAHARANEIDAAIASYRDAVSKDGSLVEARVGLATMLERNGDTAGAVEQLNAALSARSWSADVHYNLGRLLTDANAAVEHLAQAVAIRPAFTDAQLEYGRRLSAVGRYADAVAPLRAALAALPNVGQVKELLGIALWKTGALDEAETLLRGAVQAVSNSARANEALGEVLIALNKTDDGLGFLETASNLDRSNVGIQYRMAELLHAAGRDTLATGWLDKAIGIRATFSLAHQLYADILFGQNRYAEAMVHYQAAVAGDGQGIDAARCSQRIGQIQAGIQPPSIEDD